MLFTFSLFIIVLIALIYLVGAFQSILVFFAIYKDISEVGMYTLRSARNTSAF